MKKKNIINFVLLICILLSGCGNSSKKQYIVEYDYLQNKEIIYNVEDEEINNFVDDLSDFIMDGEQIEIKVPRDAINYKKLMLYQEKQYNNKQKTDEDKLMDIEIYKYDEDFYCKAKLYFSQQDCEMKLSPELSQQIKAIWKN